MVHSTRMMAAVLALGIGIGSLSADVASAGQVPASRTGAFRTWHAAQSHAGFGLLRPTRTHGLRRTPLIFVSRCQAAGKLGKIVVIAGYGSTPNANLSLNQNNSGGRCLPIGRTRRLGRFKVSGVWARLRAACGLRGFPSCRSRRIYLFLTWAKHGRYYVAISHDLRAATLLSFARSLVRVR
jgi:hypothetical protein